ncbi:MAG: conjugal transfer protein TrbL family protein [Thermomicrobiales bacterium]
MMNDRLIRILFVAALVLGLLAVRPAAAQAPTPVPTPTGMATTTPSTPVATPEPSTDGTEPPVATEAPDTSDPATSVKVGKGPFGFSIDLGDWIGKLLKGLWKALGVDGISKFGDEIAGWLLRNPDLTTNAGQMGNVQRMTDALRLASLSLVIVLFIATVYRFWLGGEQAPQASLGRLLAVLFALGFYKPLVGLLIGGSNAVTDGVLHAGANAAHPSFGTILQAIPDTGALWALAGIVALAFLFVIGVVRMLGFAFLLVLYVAGPLVLPLGLVPETAGYCSLWGKHGVKLLFWPTIWAIEFRLFDALKEGLYLSPDSVGHAILAPFAALGMLLVMFKTPIFLHSGTFEQHARTGGRAVKTAVVTIFTGGAGGAATAASTGTATTGAQTTGTAPSGSGVQP